MSGNIEARFHTAFGAFQLDIALTIPGRGITAFFGPSGCGKTSLLRCIAGLHKTPNGFLRVDQNIWQDASIFVPTHRRALGYVFQEASLFAHLDVQKNLEYGWRRTPLRERRVNFDEIIALLGAEPLLAQKPDTLSGGQRQRVAIARALLCSPQLLLMDEPLANLDLDSRAEILPYLEQLHDRLDIPIIYVSHSPAEVAQLADHMVLLENGRVSANGALNDILTRTDLLPAQQDEASAVIEGHVVEHQREFLLTQIAVAGGHLAVAYRDLEKHHKVRVRILARDVSIALEPPQRTSITNVLPARIIDIMIFDGSAQALVKLDLGGTIILARITRRSVAMLDLKPAMIVYAQIKSVALMH
ncbi:MAG TPA: molybdenum ABC transporter ATP-binding protein [Spongiibacteraceae bacterium]